MQISRMPLYFVALAQYSNVAYYRLADVRLYIHNVLSKYFSQSDFEVAAIH